MAITGRNEQEIKAVANDEARITYVVSHSQTVKTALAYLTDIELSKAKHLLIDDKKLSVIAAYLGALKKFKQFKFYEKFIFAQCDNPHFWKALEEKQIPIILQAIDLYLSQDSECSEWLRNEILDFAKVYHDDETKPDVAIPTEELEPQQSNVILVKLVICRLLVNEAANYGARLIDFRDDYFMAPDPKLARVNKPQLETTYLASSLNSVWRTAAKSASLICDAGAQVVGFVSKPTRS